MGANHQGFETDAFLSDSGWHLCAAESPLDLIARRLLQVQAAIAAFPAVKLQLADGSIYNHPGKVVKEMPDSGIKDFFDIANTMEGALSLGVGEPDFPTPEHVREAAIASIKRGETKYTDNRGTVELRAAAAEYLEKFGLHYDREI